MTTAATAAALRWVAQRLTIAASRVERHTTTRVIPPSRHYDEAHYERMFTEMRARIQSRFY